MHAVGSHTVMWLHSKTNQELYDSASVNKSSHCEKYESVCALVKGATPINYHLKSEVSPLCFVVSYVQPVTQQYKSETILKAYL